MESEKGGDRTRMSGDASINMLTKRFRWISWFSVMRLLTLSAVYQYPVMPFLWHRAKGHRTCSTILCLEKSRSAGQHQLYIEVLLMWLRRGLGIEKKPISTIYIFFYFTYPVRWHRDRTKRVGINVDFRKSDFLRSAHYLNIRYDTFMYYLSNWEVFCACVCVCKKNFRTSCKQFTHTSTTFLKKK